ncbi:hypothetical protein NM688_g739 [Phlebia brevispora]|uniref:Uncharacterized protein n=1 Tax=Phlebia brevispora TaxID=194682 RepID=A0ACC1TDP6_9APHY|nr:hypothetical protein NM688_g739 [Phlebia brevispora]
MRISIVSDASVLFVMKNPLAPPYNYGTAYNYHSPSPIPMSPMPPGPNANLPTMRRYQSTMSLRTEYGIGRGTPDVSPSPDPQSRWRTLSETSKAAKPTSKCGLKRTDSEKVPYVLGALQEFKWSISFFLHEVTMLVDPSGKPKPTLEDASLVYNTEISYNELKYARVVFSYLAAQLVEEDLATEIRKATKRESGSQGSGVNMRGREEIGWDDIRPSTVQDVMKIVQECQTLTWDLIKSLVTPPTRLRNGVRIARRTWPPDLTATEIISTIDFAHANTARHLPAARAILYFACDIPYSPTEAALAICAKLKQRELRVGWEDQMKIGVAAAVAEVIDSDPEAFDLDSKLAKIAENKRKDLTVDILLE